MAVTHDTGEMELQCFCSALSHLNLQMDCGRVARCTDMMHGILHTTPLLLHEFNCSRVMM